MERIKEALEQARRARDKALQESTLNDLKAGSANDVNDLIDARRIRERIPFNQLGSGEQQALIAQGEVLRVEAGARVFMSGTEDPYVHYLLEGAVSIASDNAQGQTLYAYQESALLPLDEAGVKTHTVTAVIASRIFRIAQSRLQEPLPTASKVSSSAPALTEEATPRDLYTHTYSGEQLAQLVEQLHQDSQQLTSDYSASKSARPLDEVRFGENTIGVKIDAPAPNLEATIAPSTVTQEALAPAAIGLPSRDEINDEIGRFTRDLEMRFRRYVQQVRAEERQRAQAQLQRHAKRLQALAEQQLRAKIETVRERYQAAYIAREKKLRERYEHLIAMANKMTRQKAAIYQARRQLEDKLRLAEQVHNELAQIGLTVTRQLNDLEGMIPDDEQAVSP